MKNSPLLNCNIVMFIINLNIEHFMGIENLFYTKLNPYHFKSIIISKIEKFREFVYFPYYPYLECKQGLFFI